MAGLLVSSIAGPPWWPQGWLSLGTGTTSSRRMMPIATTLVSRSRTPRLRTRNVVRDVEGMRSWRTEEVSGRSGCEGPSSLAIEVLQESMGSELDLLVSPLGGPVLAAIKPVRWTDGSPRRRNHTWPWCPQSHPRSIRGTTRHSPPTSATPGTRSRRRPSVGRRPKSCRERTGERR